MFAVLLQFYKFECNSQVCQSLSKSVKIWPIFGTILYIFVMRQFYAFMNISFRFNFHFEICTNLQQSRYDLPQPWVKNAMQCCAWSVLIQTIMVVLVPQERLFWPEGWSVCMYGHILEGQISAVWLLIEAIDVALSAIFFRAMSDL